MVTHGEILIYIINKNCMDFHGSTTLLKKKNLRSELFREMCECACAHNRRMNLCIARLIYSEKKRVCSLIYRNKTCGCIESI